MPDADRADAVLTIDLGAIASNYRQLRNRASPAQCAAVVKADAYGLGAAGVVRTLANTGCSCFFVAQVDEGITVRRMLDGFASSQSDVYVLNGAPPGAEEVLAEHHLNPVLNSLGDVEAWARFARMRETPLAAALHVDTGMSRLGLPETEFNTLIANPGPLRHIRLTHVMSHLACADEPDHPLNQRQLEAFTRLRRVLPEVPTCFANSSGIFLGSAYHGDMVRPGAALYGIAPHPGRPNPMAQVVRLQGKILQVRAIDTPQTVGYGATYQASRRERIATVAVGYADGYSRALSNRGHGHIGDTLVPLVGRVSMDLTTFDVSAVPEHEARPGVLIDLIGPHNSVDDVAAAAGTIGYEILTSLGARYRRVFKD